VCVLSLGCDVSLVLRSGGDHFELIGECYVDGYMEGEAMNELPVGNLGLQTFDFH